MSWSLRRCSSQVGADWVLAVFRGGPTASTGQLAPSDCGGRRHAVCLQRGTPESADMSAADGTCTRQPPSAILGVMPALCRLLAGRERSRRSRSVTDVPPQGRRWTILAAVHKRGLLFYRES